MSSVHDKSDDEYSVIGDKGDIGFVDFENCKSICSYNPSEESQIFYISVPFPLVCGKPQSGTVGETLFTPITVKNIGAEPLDVWSISIYDSKPENSFTISLMEPPTANSDAQYIQDFMESFSLEDRVLHPDQKLTIWLSCKPKEIGLHTTAVHFSVGDDTIERLVFVLAEDKISQSLASLKPFNRRRTKKQNIVDVHAADAAFVVGGRPSKGSSCDYSFRLPNYPIPENIRVMVCNKQIPDEVRAGLTRRNYSSYFKTLIAMEEIKLEEDMRGYDMESVSMKIMKNQFLSLEVPGLAERRPSLVNGDFIYVKLACGDAAETVPYKGFIHRVEAEEIHMKFDQKFHRNHRESNLYNVQFTYNRIGMRRLYKSIEAAESLDMHFLFPFRSNRKTQVLFKPLVPISCALNEEQMIAVKMILSCKGGSPFVIHGPPGTGKTMTLIETILQVYRRERNARILICAPSNSAADHILERLMTEKSATISSYDIFRLNAFTRPFEDVNPNHIGFCCVEDFIFKCPPLSDLRNYRIIISTYSSASLLYGAGIKRDYFSHIFLDEAGQASEPEAMIPLAHLYTKGTVVVLAGDPLQLGPVVFSRNAESCGLGTSYLERLFGCELYANGNENYIIKLVRNYRSHQAILHLPSQLFYDGELIACKYEKAISSWETILPYKDFPLLFIGIQGCDEREGHNPSWFNRIEASKVVEVIRDLMVFKELKDEDIGVITPYRQQVLKIKTALENYGQPDIKVGSVEQFQGQEREVIIMSTVRSTVKHNEFDRVHYLGFLSNPKRFNVALTRAKSLLVVIGNPHILSKDPHWNKLLWYCVDNGSYKGCFLPEREEFGAEGCTGTDQVESSQYLGYDGRNNFQSSEVPWNEEVDSWKPSEIQWGEEESSSQLHNGSCGNHERDNWSPSDASWGDCDGTGSQAQNGSWDPEEKGNQKHPVVEQSLNGSRTDEEQNSRKLSEVQLNQKGNNNGIATGSWVVADDDFQPSDIPWE